MIPSNDLLRPDNQGSGDYAAMRARLGFALTPKPRVRVDLARPWLRPAPPPAPVEALVVVAQPPPKDEQPPAYGAPFNFLKQPGWAAIVKLVSLKHQVPVETILGSMRSRQIVDARQEAMHKVFTHCRDMSLPEIGKRFNKDHTTVLHAVRVIEGRPKSRAHKC